MNKRIPTAVANIFVAANVVAMDFVSMFNAAFAISYYIKKKKNYKKNINTD